jgi:hypothetical protein
MAAKPACNKLPVDLAPRTGWRVGSGRVLHRETVAGTVRPQLRWCLRLLALGILER